MTRRAHVGCGIEIEKSHQSITIPKEYNQGRSRNTKEKYPGLPTNIRIHTKYIVKQKGQVKVNIHNKLNKTL